MQLNCGKPRWIRIVGHCCKSSLEDAQDADEIFEMLMGDRVEPRRDFIQAYANQANLDV